MRVGNDILNVRVRPDVRRTARRDEEPIRAILNAFPAYFASVLDEMPAG